MKSYTIMLEEADIIRLQDRAKQLRLPPHVYARSMLLRALEGEIVKGAIEGAQPSKEV